MKESSVKSGTEGHKQWMLFKDEERFLFEDWIEPHTLEVFRERDVLECGCVEADLMTMDLGRRFDVVVCIGVIHHTDDPDRTFETQFRHRRPGGWIIALHDARKMVGVVYSRSLCGRLHLHTVLCGGQLLLIGNAAPVIDRQSPIGTRHRAGMPCAA